MRAVRALLFVLAGVVVLALATAWFLPDRLDWTRYRGIIEAIAGNTLGRPVRIDGRVGLALLPEPVITADGVDIADGRGGATLRVRALRLRVALMALLRGRIEPRELVLREPLLTLPWPLPDSLALSVPDWFGTFSARIEGGRLRLGALEFGGIDATLTDMASGVTGISGTTRVTGLDWHFSARLTPAGGDGAQGLDVALEGKEQASGLGGTFAGQIEPDGSVDGRFSGRGPDLSLLMPAPHVPFHGEGRLATTSGLVAFEDMDVTLDGAQLQGAASLRMRPTQRIDVALAAGQINLEPWLPILRAVAPAPVPVGLDFSAEAAGLAGGVMRRVRVAIDEDRTGYQIRNASALLPGEAVVHLRGHLAAEGRTRPHFSGEFGLDAPDFPTSLGWFDTALGWGRADLPANLLRAVSLQGEAEAAPGAVELRSLSGQIDGAPFTGRFGLNVGARPVIAADLAF
ncbi:MAG: AsmA family protein, partial [Alphaproteobacteria bacterium]|nr:AsmA family protein [Alphaproteobacteria bacterium]